MGSAPRAPGSPLRVVDARFALPTLPRSAAVLGDLQEWRDGFALAGVHDVAPDVADVVVADAGASAAALAHRRPATILTGAGLESRANPRVLRLMTLPSHAPRVLLDLDHHGATAHAIGRLLPTSRPRDLLRNRAAATLLRHVPQAVPLRPDVTIRIDAGRTPALLTAMAHAGVTGNTPWCLALSAGRTERKCAFFLFGEGDEPDRVLKFKRLPGGSAHFDAVADGLERARSAAGPVARTAPALLGRAVVNGHPLLLESAVRGVPLQRTLAGRGSERHKLELAGRVAAWTTEVAASTWGRSETGTATVFEHGDLWEENVLIDGGQFALVDWEESRDAGTPLWDLLYFAIHALPLAGGARADDDRLSSALALVRGEHRLSGVLRRWMADYIGAIDLAAAEVGTIVTERWRQWLGSYFGAPPEAAGWFVPRLGRAWMSSEDLGGAWSAWR